MQQFTDNAGRIWTVEINIAALKRCRDLAKVDLMEALDNTLIEQFIRDPVLLCDAVYAVCKPQADALGITDEDFGRAMAGDAIEHATDCMLDELVSFFPSPRDRATLQQVLSATRNVMSKARNIVEARLKNGELDKAMEHALESLKLDQ